jgi:hypothetical protein
MDREHDGAPLNPRRAIQPGGNRAPVERLVADKLCVAELLLGNAAANPAVADPGPVHRTRVGDVQLGRTARRRQDYCHARAVRGQRDRGLRTDEARPHTVGQAANR